MRAFLRKSDKVVSPFADMLPKCNPPFSKAGVALGGQGARAIRKGFVNVTGWNMIVRTAIIFLIALTFTGVDAADPVTSTREIAQAEAAPVEAAANTAKEDQAEHADEAEAHDDAMHAAGEHHDEAHHYEEAHAGGHDDHGPKLGTLIPMASMIPFGLLLLSIAVFPLANPHWWEHNSSKGMIAAILAIPTAIYLATLGTAGTHALLHAGEEYISFVLLLGSLFVISGGVYVRGRMACTPAMNTLVLTIGTAIASFVGTTGASMLLIRPLLRANAVRNRVAHIVVFFIFTVSNCGGLLTPLGDPPLFLGFLKGVPFEWTFRLTPQWLVVNGILLATFFIWDTLVYNAEKKRGEIKTQDADGTVPESFGLEGVHNFGFLLAIVAIIYCKGNGIGFGGKDWPMFMQEGLMLATGVASYILTSSVIRSKNRFSFAPINEVAILFAGIFVTMIPALAILNVEGKNLGLTEDWQFFWASGVLSSFLDNAPTYLTFAATAAGIEGIELEGKYLAEYLKLDGAAAIMAAISCGAVFMGANTYIGNGPNFMVKAIAEENNVRMPSFFGYMAYSVGILIPIFAVITVIFFV